MHIDLNADLGESFGSWVKGNDEALLDIISSANIACGFHAGDPDVMTKTIKLAKSTRRMSRIRDRDKGQWTLTRFLPLSRK